MGTYSCRAVLNTVQALAEDPEACALLMFPTKALAQDQRSAIQRLLAAAFPEGLPAVEVYDGDTPHAQRADIRTRVRILVTNPDMLHVSILPAHASFERFLANLRYAVVDESHMCAPRLLLIVAVTYACPCMYRQPATLLNLWCCLLYTSDAADE